MALRRWRILALPASRPRTSTHCTLPAVPRRGAGARPSPAPTWIGRRLPDIRKSCRGPDAPRFLTPDAWASLSASRIPSGVRSSGRSTPNTRWPTAAPRCRSGCVSSWSRTPPPCLPSTSPAPPSVPNPVARPTGNAGAWRTPSAVLPLAGAAVEPSAGINSPRPNFLDQRHSAARGAAAAPPAVLHKLEGAGCHEDRSPPLRGLILTGPHPAPLARSVSLWRTAPPITRNCTGEFDSPAARRPVATGLFRGRV